MHYCYIIPASDFPRDLLRTNYTNIHNNYGKQFSWTVFTLTCLEIACCGFKSFMCLSNEKVALILKFEPSKVNILKHFSFPMDCETSVHTICAILTVERSFKTRVHLRTRCDCLTSSA